MGHRLCTPFNSVKGRYNIESSLYLAEAGDEYIETDSPIGTPTDGVSPTGVKQS